jgi:hypothetical protein
MPDTPRAQRLLAVFTSAHSAEGIAGDLAEAQEAASSFWFWRQVLTTTLTLWGRTITEAPLAALVLAFGGCWLLASSVLCSIAAIGLFPQYVGSAGSWIVLTAIWWGGAFSTGASLVGVAQERGMAACVILAIIAEALLVPWGTTFIGAGILGSPNIAFSVVAALTPVPVLTGGALVRLRALARNNHVQEA